MILQQRRQLDCDVAVVGAGPIGIAVGAAISQVGLEPLLVDQGPLLAALLKYPTGMRFFSTRERLAIAGIPFSLPEDRPTREQAIAYYQGVFQAFRLRVQPHSQVCQILPQGETLSLELAAPEGAERRILARAVVVATGFSSWPRRLGVPGEQEPWVRHRFREAWEHFGERVAVIGGGNSAIETALTLYRHGAHVVWVHRGPEPKPSVKYWLKPDFQHRLAEGAILGFPNSTVTSFSGGRIALETPRGPESLVVDAAYVLIGFKPDLRLLKGAGVELCGADREPVHEAESGATAIPGLYLAGTVRAGDNTHRIFIENARAEMPGLIRHLLRHRFGRVKEADLEQKLLAWQRVGRGCGGFEEE